ncbi:hypothetical protein [Nocardia sp. NBC_00416]|uniref:hypothetical protein n=1 Tax=Nocardia sp. NBC_00416 TaxID=2975991 RepID=UPI002E226486
MGETDPSLVADWQSLGSGKLVLGEGVAFKCAVAYKNAFGRVEQIKSAIIGLEAPTGFTMKSAADLMGWYHEKLAALTSAVEAHERVLNDVFTTLVTAGKTYALAEQNSAAAFDDIVANGALEAEVPDSYNVMTTNGAIPNWVQKGTKSYPSAVPRVGPEFPEAASGTFTKLGGEFEFAEVARNELIDTENPYWLDRPTLYKFGEQIRAVLQPLLDLSARCNWTADELDYAMNVLGTELSEVADSGSENGGWYGSAGLAVRKATNAYMSEAHKFAAGARLLADNLSFAAEWLNDTQLGMPFSAEASPTVLSNTGEVDLSWMPEDELADTSFMLACRHFQDYYVPGIRTSMSKLPVVPEPTNPVNPPEDEDPKEEEPEGGGTTFPPGGPGGLSPIGPGSGGYSAMSASVDNGLTGTPSRSESGTGAGVGTGANALGQLSSLGREVANGLQNLAGVAKGATPGGRPTLPAGLPGRSELAGKASGAGLGGPGGGGLGVGAGPSPPGNVDASKLFPRAGIPAMPAVPTPMGTTPFGGGYPPPMGSGAGAAGRQDNRYERPDHVLSREYLHDALGDSTFATKPVLEQ